MSVPVFAVSDAPPADASTTTVAAGAAEVAYTGRVLREDDGVLLAFPGTEVRVRFRGAKLVLHGTSATGENWFNLQVDGAPRPRIDAGTGAFDLTLAAGLDPEADHEVRLVRRNESWQGTARLESFALPEGGSFLPAPPARARRILCLGDSITCGTNVDFIPPYAPAGNSVANAEGTYAWLLAKHFGADVNLVSYGGRGIVRDWQGLTDTGRAIELFRRTHADRDEPVWDHRRYEPDLITICFGTNDYASGALDREVFVKAYEELLDEVHAQHPGAKILLLSSPMLPAYAPDKAAEVVAALKTLEATVKARGEDFVRVWVFGNYGGTAWDPHPIASQHEAMAAELEPLIREWLDWES